MSKRKISKQELLENRDEILAEYTKVTPKHKKPAKLSKKAKKVLGVGKDCGKAKSDYIRIAASKVRIVADIVRGEDLNYALSVLKYTNKAASPYLIEVLESAKANAVNNNGLNPDLLYVSDIQVNEGPVMKRWIPRGKGSAGRINKRSSRVSVIVKEKPVKEGA